MSYIRWSSAKWDRYDNNNYFIKERHTVHVVHKNVHKMYEGRGGLLETYEIVQGREGVNAKFERIYFLNDPLWSLFTIQLMRPVKENTAELR